MPYSSKAQQRFFHYMQSKGKMPKKTVNEYDQSTDFEDLPEKVEGYAMGGMIEDDFDYEKEHEEEFDSSGEPHTNDDLEDRHPMEYMNRGGKVRGYASGGMVSNPVFVKAIKRQRR